MEIGDADFDSAAALLQSLSQNVDEFTLARNRKTNAKLPRLHQGWRGIEEVALLGGGPSMILDWELIKDLKGRSVTIATVNGAHKWANDSLFWPSFQFVVDARPLNAKFTHPPTPGTWYVVCDHCDPAIIDGIPPGHLYVWSVKDFKCGSTVMLCAIPILKWMGVKKLHLFGFDSCMPYDECHHAYPQPENDADPAIWTEINGRWFLCTRWMMQQAEEFLELRRDWGDFTIYGNGLLAHLMKTTR